MASALRSIALTYRSRCRLAAWFHFFAPGFGLGFGFLRVSFRMLARMIRLTRLRSARFGGTTSSGIISTNLPSTNLKVLGFGLACLQGVVIALSLPHF